MNHSGEHHADLQPLQQRALIVGTAGIALCLVGWLMEPAQFFRSYLLGYLLWVGAGLGSASLLMIHHLAGGSWGFVIRRFLESALRTLPVLAVLILPVLLGLEQIYLWAQPEAVARDALLQHKAPYLNVPFFVLRTVCYFAIWGAMAYGLVKWSVEQDRTGEPRLGRRLEVLSGPGLALMGLTITFSAVDWVMSLDPHWFSTLFGFIFMVNHVLTALALVICALAFFRDREPLAGVIQTQHFHDLGNLLMAFVLLWAYMALSQYLIIWSGNLPEEITWYVDRTSSGWSAVALILVVFHFAVPFLVLLSRHTKRTVRNLVAVAVFLLVMRLVDLVWTVTPSFTHEELVVHWMDIAAPVGIGGLWVAAFLWKLRASPLLPLKDPAMAEAQLAGGHE